MIIDSLSKKQNISIMKQDKGRGVVVMNRSNYTEKCLNILKMNNSLNWGMIQQILSKTRYNGN